LLSVGVPETRHKEFQTWVGKGCEKCNGSGYKGRTGLFEVMPISTAIQELILSGANTLRLRDKAREEGMITLREHGIQKIKEGMTTVEEVLRETSTA
jgi:type IV pilus assembly protein PilB